MADFTERLRRIALVAVACPALAAAQALPPLDAHYEFLRNGTPLGVAGNVHQVTQTGWRVENSSEGTQGTARLLGFTERSSSEGDWRQGLPRPARFHQAVRVATRDREWSAVFDWASGKVESRYKDGESQLDLPAGTLDPLSAGLRIRLGLAQGEDHWRFPMVDEDEIDSAEFRAFPPERLDTELGCLVTRRVEKVRSADSKRYTRTWYASDHGWAPVRIEHGKTGGNHLETRILTLSVNGLPVASGPPCANADD